MGKKGGVQLPSAVTLVLHGLFHFIILLYSHKEVVLKLPLTRRKSFHSIAETLRRKKNQTQIHRKDHWKTLQHTNGVDIGLMEEADIGENNVRMRGSNTTDCGTSLDGTKGIDAVAYAM